MTPSAPPQTTGEDHEVLTPENSDLKTENSSHSQEISTDLDGLGSRELKCLARILGIRGDHSKILKAEMKKIIESHPYPISATQINEARNQVKNWKK